MSQPAKRIRATSPIPPILPQPSTSRASFPCTSATISELSSTSSSAATEAAAISSSSSSSSSLATTGASQFSLVTTAKVNNKSSVQYSVNGPSAIPYAIYLYRSELKRRDHNCVKLCRAKIILTQHLVAGTVNQLHGSNRITGNWQDMKDLTRQVMYKKELIMRAGLFDEMLRNSL